MSMLHFSPVRYPNMIELQAKPWLLAELGTVLRCQYTHYQELKVMQGEWYRTEWLPHMSATTEQAGDAAEPSPAGSAIAAAEGSDM